ncbi:Rare lipoprotein B [Coxiella endosymbiont of Amblyomma americanum]|nr:Rare lipoprotein B [Coxiella endosymbiont of Amblyomma americanum]
MLDKIRVIFLILISVLICNALVGCGFQPRLSGDVPSCLRSIYIDSSQFCDPLIIQLRKTLQALTVHITKQKETALVILRIIDIHWKPLIPNILYSNGTTSYIYLLSVDFDLETRNGKILIGPKNITLQRHLIQNISQVYTPNANQLMKKEMVEAMVSLIYRVLIVYGGKIK